MQDPLLLLPPALDQLLVIRRWLELALAHVDARITTVRAADAQRAHRLPPQEPPRWWIESGIGAGRQPDRVPTGACKVTSRGRAATRQMILEVLRTVPSAIACPLCRPDSEPVLLDTRPDAHPGLVAQSGLDRRGWPDVLEGFRGP
ncbi:DUF6233 domain-containing protein [Streptomyces sp. NPDC002602]|uniref:DUF6233 domain-containing protein n=1 Tax=Streptomyces sp. NPDC002602 TaxID=3364654 RepID=UPI00368EB553